GTGAVVLAALAQPLARVQAAADVRLLQQRVLLLVLGLGLLLVVLVLILLLVGVRQAGAGDEAAQRRHGQLLEGASVQVVVVHVVPLVLSVDSAKAAPPPEKMIRHRCAVVAAGNRAVLQAPSRGGRPPRERGRPNQRSPSPSWRRCSRARTTSASTCAP